VPPYSWARVNVRPVQTSGVATPSERREHARSEVSGDVELVMATHVQRAAMVDVSEGGVCVRSEFAGGGWGDRVELRGVGAVGRPGVRCHLVRVRNDADGVKLGLRFDPSEPRPRERVLELLGIKS
jgi:hypothetical protein